MLNMKTSKRWGFIAAIAIGIFSTSNNANAGDKTLQTVVVQGHTLSDQSIYSGQVHRIEDGGRHLVIDDTLINVSPLIKLDGLTTSRERLKTQLSEGQTVRFHLSSSNKVTREVIEIETN